jgi:hypothetical protein
MRFNVPVTVTREVPFPQETAFEWFTDYGDEDPERTDTVIEERRVVEESEDRVVLEGVTSVLGRTASGRAVVELDPPDRWVATVEEGGPRPDGSRFVYELEETGPDSCRLEVTYNIPVEGVLDRVKFWLIESKIESQLEDMWDGFIESMEEELGEAPAAEAAA